MSNSTLPAPLDQADYAMIEAAVMETSRGRWFLAEYARKNRHADTVQILGAIRALEQNIAEAKSAVGLERIQADVLEMARAIKRTHREIDGIRAEGQSATYPLHASRELDAVVATTERATSNILAAAERVQEIAWTLREREQGDIECEQLDSCASEIYTACSFQDLTAQRIRKVVQALGFLETRIHGMMDALSLSIEDEPLSDAPLPVAMTDKSDVAAWLESEAQSAVDFTFAEVAADDGFAPRDDGEDPVSAVAEKTHSDIWAGDAQDPEAREPGASIGAPQADRSPVVMASDEAVAPADRLEAPTSESAPTILGPVTAAPPLSEAAHTAPPVGRSFRIETSPLVASERDEAHTEPAPAGDDVQTIWPVERKSDPFERLRKPSLEARLRMFR